MKLPSYRRLMLGPASHLGDLQPLQCCLEELGPISIDEGGGPFGDLEEALGPAPVGLGDGTEFFGEFSFFFLNQSATCSSFGLTWVTNSS